MSRIVLSLILLHSFFSLSAQFTDVTVAQGIIHQYPTGGYGGGVSAADWDNDGWDDITFTQKGSNCLFYKNNNGVFQLIPAPVSNIGEVKQLTWVDFDNDGDKDIFVTRYEDTFDLFQNNGNFQFTNISVAAGFIGTYTKTYGHSWGDYDRDGWLDVYICNYDFFSDITNLLYHNNGDGTFSEVSVAAGVDNGSQPSFMGVWTDYNRDGWPDLFVINDRTEFANSLYHNNGDGTFDDVTVAAGLNDYIWAMSNTWHDVDNDGDLDLYLSNGTDGNLFQINNGDGTFTEIAETAGVSVNAFCWGAQFFDFQNDGLADLHVCASIYSGTNGLCKAYQQTGDLEFTNVSVTSGLCTSGLNSYSAGQGDFNNDGFGDLVVMRSFPGFSGLYMNSMSQLNWLKVEPRGVVSNKDGIGAWIDLWAEGQHFSRFTFCGESFESQNSNREIFGLGEIENIDSLVISWPSGVVDTWYDVEVNQHIIALEGSSVQVNLNYSTTILCEESTIQLVTDLEGEVEWSTGEEGPFIWVDEPGDYYATVTTPEGFEVVSDTITITAAPQVGVNYVLTEPSCYGYNDGEILVETTGGEIDSLFWNGIGPDFNPLTDIAAGEYQLALIDEYGCYHPMAVITLDEPEELEWTGEIHHVNCENGNDGYVMVTDVNSTDYILEWSNGDTGLEADTLDGGEYTWTITDINGCENSGTVIIETPDPTTFEIIVSDVLCNGDDSGSVIVNIEGNAGPYYFEWLADSTALLAGDYIVDISNANGCYWELEFTVDEPEALLVTIDFIYDEDDQEYYGTAEVAGGTPGYFYNWSTGDTTQQISVNDGALYFVEVTDANGCVVSAQAIFNSIFENENSFIVYPNPADDFVNVIGLKGNYFLLYDSSGRVVMESKINSDVLRIDVSEIVAGNYSLRSDLGEMISLQIR